MLDALIEALTAFTVIQSQLFRKINWLIQGPKQHLGRKSNLRDYHSPSYFSRIGPGYCSH